MNSIIQGIIYLESFNMVSVLIRLLIATVLGGLIGLERASKGQPAGVRTFALVCVGAALSTVANLYLYETTGNTDTARIPAAVLNGIGFLGVGTIVVTGRNYVRGITTAATLWASAALGITIGSGYIIGSLIGFVAIIFIVIALSRASQNQEERAARMSVYIELDKSEGLQKVFDYVHDNDFEVATLEKSKKAMLNDKDTAVVITIDLKKHTKHSDITAQLSELECVHYIEEIRRTGDDVK
ncbi:MAG: MgtC/SapB family protein [Lachnospiraceae bacterium]|nr:MgtC/SapB family protein [Lachnospiraceae bacterium]